MADERSYIYIKNNNDPRMLPCGTREMTGRKPDYTGEGEVTLIR